MAFWTASPVGLVIAYLLGSVPTGYLAGKLLRGHRHSKAWLQVHRGNECLPDPR